MQRSLIRGRQRADKNPGFRYSASQGARNRAYGSIRAAPSALAIGNCGLFVVFPHPVDDRGGRRRTNGNQTPA
jgi:hypothetical protein